MNESTLKVEGARYIITVDPQRRIIEDGTVVVQGQRIVQIGKRNELAEVSADRVMDARGMVITPGFCNGHLHVSYAHATRGIFPDDLGPDYLPNVFKLQASMTAEEEYYTSLLGITELLKYGTTCFLDPGSTKFPSVCLQAYEESGCRIIIGAQVVDQENPLNIPIDSTNEAVSKMRDVIETYDGKLDGRVRAWAMPFSADYASLELLQEAKGLADAHDTGLTLHQSNAAPSVQMSLDRYGRRPVEHLEDIGVLGPNTLLAHVIGLNESEVDVMARTRTNAVMCPTAALKMGGGTTSRGMLPEMLANGVTVGLGTDAANNSNLVETMRSMYLAAVLYKDGRQSTEMISAESALEMATIGGAKALGLGGDIGSIEVGKKADLVLFDTRRAEWRTLFNPVNNLVYGADGRSVHTVIVDGNVRVEDHRPIYVDEWDLIQKVQALGTDLMARTGVSFPSRWPLV
ncbi:MAG: amidohydrolase family protein [Dehalococcoidia bacterium]|nr:amidohydrolase family protein [Dehalococcoidia bacterium]